MTSARSQIIDDVVAALKALPDFEGRIHEWMPADPDTALPHAVVLPLRGNPGAPPDLGLVRESLEVQVVVCALHDQDTATESGWRVVERLVTAVQKALMADEQWGGKAIQTDTTPWEMGAPEDARPNEVRAAVLATIDYRYARGNPEDQQFAYA